MVVGEPVIFAVIYRGVLDWRVSAGDSVENIPFNSLTSCIRAATNRARDHHLRTGLDTEVWAPGLGGKRECVIRFTPTEKFNAALDHSTSLLREACDGFGLPGNTWARLHERS